ncbi:uncharacterized protein FOMMEDRAFT_25426 [Fomitiporia mediterranea MF3/22]|uniref:uncharacterized protein n=1 Tax=Fomitiporia mediterranea (strain MF3/22) TaxID=694068 RepID=UPI0004407478|nr:uncharacterized protein FOMMEDRAFT_25426 [Fomitiporia mediterranea MF3/22]EJD08305.1 hypothetical protein FOMMEDRAFT_25426 [Fomitiporia mediterranea MF3/22]
MAPPVSLTSYPTRRQRSFSSNSFTVPSLHSKPSASEMLENSVFCEDNEEPRLQHDKFKFGYLAKMLDDLQATGFTLDDIPFRIKNIYHSYSLAAAQKQSLECSKANFKGITEKVLDKECIKFNAYSLSSHFIQLDAAFQLNNYGFYITMTFGATSAAGLFQWEQSAETVSFAPIVPVTLFWTTVLCTFAFPLSLLVQEEIKELRNTLEQCVRNADQNECTATGQKDNAPVDASTETIGKHARPGGGEPNVDLESDKVNTPRCKCVMCMPKAMQYFTFCVLFLPPVFSVIAIILCMVTLISLMKATESVTTFHIAVTVCIPIIAPLLIALVWLLYRRSGLTRLLELKKMQDARN